MYFPVNFDCLSSPIRMLQRVGRTGRKRAGRVVSLVAQGPEERTYAIIVILYFCRLSIFIFKPSPFFLSK